MAEEPNLSVVLPCFNAAEYLRPRVRLLIDYLADQPLSYELVLVDDGSDDGTREIIEELRGPQIVPVLLPENLGKFGALRAGMARTSGEACLFTDADVPYSLDVIPHMTRLVSELGFHIAVGDRTLNASAYAQKGTRWIANRVFSNAIRLLYVGSLHDTQCGIKAFRGDVARAIFPLVQENGFVGDVELLYIALKYNLAIRRVPVRLRYQGASSVRVFRDGLSMLRGATLMRSKYRRGEYESPSLRRIASEP